MILEWSIDIYICGNIRGNISGVMLIIIWKCFVNNIGYYIDLEFGRGKYKKNYSVFCVSNCKKLWYKVAIENSRYYKEKSNLKSIYPIDKDFISKCG